MNQTLLVLLASAILGIVAIGADKMYIQRQQALMSTEATTTATALGQELIEEITVRQFDENFPNDSTGATSASQFSSQLGKDLGEDSTNAATFDDVDDFNGYSTTIATPRLGGFSIQTSVYYVDEDKPNVVSGSKTYLKRVDVVAKNSYIMSPDSSAKVSKIISYRYKG